MKRQLYADLAMTGALLLLGASLVFSGFSLLRMRWSSIESGRLLDLPELMGVGSAGAGLALLCWWLTALICALIFPLAQHLGAQRLAAFTNAYSPAFMRRIVIAVVGINLLAAPLATAAPSDGSDPRWQPGTVATTTAPSSPAEISALPPETSVPVEPAWVPRTAATDPALLARPPARIEQLPSDAPQEQSQNPVTETDVVVQQGDSLWSIVAAALGPFSNDVDVARAWPRWYSANREAIGPDPNIIFPGQILHAPTAP